MNRILIVANFSAGRKKAVKYKKKIIDFVLKYTKTFKFVDIDELKDTDTEYYDTIIAVGGDGTVNKILPFMVNTDKVLGIIPCGTANLLAAKLGIPSNINEALKIIEHGNNKKIDVLDINQNLSILRCGFGYDSDIICKTPQSLKNKFGYFAYFIAGIIFALRLKQKEYTITIDQTNKKVKASSIIFANSGNMFCDIVSVGLNSKLDDGLIDVFILKVSNPIIFFLEFSRIIFGIKKNSFRAEYLKAKNISIVNQISTGHIDGEKKKFKDTINITLIPKSINVFYCAK